MGETSPGRHQKSVFCCFLVFLIFLLFFEFHLGSIIDCKVSKINLSKANRIYQCEPPGVCRHKYLERSPPIFISISDANPSYKLSKINSDVSNIIPGAAPNTPAAPEAAL